MTRATEMKRSDAADLSTGAIATAAVSLDSALCRTYAALPDKFVVDLVNGLDVTRDHTRVQRGRSQRFFARLVDGIGGRGAQRQVEVNERLTDGLEATLTWLNQLNQQVAFGHRAVAQVTEKVAHIARAVSHVADFSGDTRRRLEALAQDVAVQFDAHAQHLARLDLQVSAGDQIQHVMGKWASGRYSAISPAARCYVAFEELQWGDFGEFMRRHGQTPAAYRLADTLLDGATTQLARDLGCDSNDRMRWDEWHQPAADNSDAQQVLSYYGAACDGDRQPVITAITGTSIGTELSPWLPRIAAPGRIAAMLADETKVKVAA